MSVREKDNPALFARVQEQNLLRQYDLLSNCLEIGFTKGIEAFDKYTLWALNYAAVANIAQFGGRYREEPIYVGNHTPPTLMMSRTRWIVSFRLSTKTGRLLIIRHGLPVMLYGDSIGFIHSLKEMEERQGPLATTSFA
jgi:hypothetical protein